MTDLLSPLKTISEKISSYQIFTYILPGIVFLAPLSWYYTKEIPATSIWEKLLICYFVGMTVSRIGTFVFESWPSHIKWKWLGIQLIDYPALIKAEKKDPKINSLLQVSNTYRSMAAASFSLLLVAILNYYFPLGFNFPHGLHILNLFLCLLFYFSFKKQYWYVNERVKNAD